MRNMRIDDAIQHYGEHEFKIQNRLYPLNFEMPLNRKLRTLDATIAEQGFYSKQRISNRLLWESLKHYRMSDAKMIGAEPLERNKTKQNKTFAEV
jgi:hypothetical protein